MVAPPIFPQVMAMIRMNRRALWEKLFFVHVAFGITTYTVYKIPVTGKKKENFYWFLDSMKTSHFNKCTIMYSFTNCIEGYHFFFNSTSVNLHFYRNRPHFV